MKQTISKTLFASLAAIGMAVMPVSRHIPGSQPLLPDAGALILEETVPSSAFNALLPIASAGPERVISTFSVIVTAYSSTPDQTDDTPFITAAGTHVRNGIVAANFLPMGTKIKLPEIYGDRIFVVEDRMHPRKQWMVDVWFPTYMEAKEFGAKDTYIEVLEG